MRTKSVSKSRIELNLKLALAAAGSDTLFITSIRAVPQNAPGMFNITVNAAKGAATPQVARGFRRFLRDSVCSKVGDVMVEAAAHDSGRNLEQIVVTGVKVTERRLANFDPQ